MGANRETEQDHNGRASHFSCEIPLRWGDMDAFGHVNNTLYLRYCEEARFLWLAERNISVSPESYPVVVTIERSEERRVGKECRSWGSKQYLLQNKRKIYTSEAIVSSERKTYIVIKAQTC